MVIKKIHIFNYNGKYYKEGTSVITPDNHSFRYGDGLFETIRSQSGNLLLEQYHFHRLFYGLKILGFQIPAQFNSVFLKDEIIKLLNKNGHNKSARIRLVVFRSNGSLGNPKNNLPNFIIQTWPIAAVAELINDGLCIDIFSDAKKSCDIISNLKTNNFLPYALAAMYAKKNKLDDCILLNNQDKICDSSVANIFIIKDNKIFTPPLTEGCIAGVMRRWIVENIKFEGNYIIEKPLHIEELKQADEVFLTNSIYPVRWVKQFGSVQYKNKQVHILYDQILKLFK